MLQYYSSGRLSQHLLWLASLAGVAGLLASRALVALSPVAAVVAVLANPHLRRDFPAFWRNGAALRGAAMLAFLLLSSVYTSAWPTWRHEVFRSLPWLGVPLAFTLAVPLSARQRLTVGAFFVLGSAAVALATLGKYWLDPTTANEAIRIGQNMQAITRIFHVPFGVMLALSFFWGLALRQEPEAGPLLRAACLAAAVVIVLTLHILAYRTGLLVFYTGLLGYTLWQLTQRHLLLGLGLLLLVLLAPVTAYVALPTVRQRVASTHYDILQYTHGRDINDYSLARRMAAMETAGSIIRRHWLVGVGPADMQPAMQDQYRRKDFGLRPENQADVHNQYLNALLGSGVLGLALWLAVLFWPLTQAWARRNPYICFFILIQATVMLTADMLSLQIGLNLFVFGYGFLVVAAETRHRRLLPPAT